MGPHGSVKKSQ
jgi:hypothetical protein